MTTMSIAKAAFFIMCTIGLQQTAATEYKLLTACFVTEPEFDPSWNNHTLADKYIFNECIMTEYNKLMEPEYKITALASWDEVEVDEYIDAIIDEHNATETEGGLRQRGRELKKKKKGKIKKRGNGGSGKRACEFLCADDSYVPPASHHRRRRTSTEDVVTFDFAVTVCLMDAKSEGYLQAYDMPNGVNVTRCVDEYIEEE